MVLGVLTWWVLQLFGWGLLIYSWFGISDKEDTLFYAGPAFIIFLVALIIGRINDLERRLTDGKR